MGGPPILRHGTIAEDMPLLAEHASARVAEALNTRQWSMFTSREVELFEREFADFVGARHAVLVNSCTTAILASLYALGLSSADIVGVPAFTYVGSALPLTEIAAKVCWLDVDPLTGNVTPGELRRRARETDLRGTVLPLLFGYGGQAKELAATCQELGIAAVFDCAQFLGDREVTARLADVGPCCFSFGDSKILRIGEGGAATTNSDEVAERVRRFRHEGESWLREDSSRVSLREVGPNDVLHGLASTQRGLNLRPLALAAVLGRAQLEALPPVLDVTARHARVYDDALADLDSVSTPTSRSVWWTYPCVLGEDRNRETVLAALLAEGIPCGVHFPRLLPEHPALEHIGVPETAVDTLIGSARFASSHIVFPIYPTLDDRMISGLSAAVRDILADERLVSAAADEAAAGFLRDARIRSLSSGLYMFLEA
jgi:perosamine synthetase